MNQETKRIEAYSIADFVKQIQDAVLEGYKINLEDNEKYPLQIGVGFYATLDKASVLTKTAKEVTVENISQVIEDLSVKLQDGKDVVKQGRKPKV